MGTLRVRSARLRLRLRLPDGGKDAAPRVSDVVQHRFIPAVLDNLRRELDANCGDDAVIRIPKLRLKLRIGPDDTDGAALARQVARDLADEVRATLTRSDTARSVSTPGVSVAFWPDRAGYIASALIAAADGKPGPETKVAEVATVFEMLIAADAAGVVRTLERVESEGALVRVLDALPPKLIRALLKRISPALPRPLTDRIFARLKKDSQGPPTDIGSVPDEGERGAEDIPKPHPAFQEDRPRGPWADADTGQNSAPSDDAPPQREPRVSSRKDADLPVGSDGEDAAERPQRFEVDEELTVGHPESSGRDSRPEVSRQERGGRSEAPADAPDDACQTYATEFGRLPSLLSVALRLEMPERLWQIGVPEGAALFAMMSIVTGHPTDPIIGLLAPEFPAPPPPVAPLPGWARTELVDTVAELAADLTEGEITASRIEQKRLAIAETAKWRIEEWGAAALLEVIEALVGGQAEAPAWEQRLRMPAVIDVSPDSIAVRLPLEAIDLDLRRAGLDRDPGWLGWLDRRMTLHFGSDDEDWAT